MANNDLVWVAQSEEEADYYLENVTTKQFILDVESLVNKKTENQYNEVLHKLNQILENTKQQK